mmetsp:Transcript_27342/g.33997  ORF Transcript_27342/g.33997 Transcript_27342/m.33997 type:complete len:82 (-) Transcript_27342:58-303(-)
MYKLIIFCDEGRDPEGDRGARNFIKTIRKSIKEELICTSVGEARSAQPYICYMASQAQSGDADVASCVPGCDELTTAPICA